jgi:hypothetical protein
MDAHDLFDETVRVGRLGIGAGKQTVEAAPDAEPDRYSCRPRPTAVWANVVYEWLGMTATKKGESATGPFRAW